MLHLVLNYRLDAVAFAAVAFAGMALAGYVVRRHGGRLGVWPWVAAVGLVVGAGGLAEKQGNDEREQRRAQVEAMAPTYAMELERMGHAKVSLETAADDPLYLSLIEAQKGWLRVNPAVHDIYTMRRRADGKVVLVVDSETDYDGDERIEGEREGRTEIGEVYDEADEGLERALAGEANFDDKPVTDRWGTWVSAWVPMRDASGKVEAVLGVDFDAGSWAQQILAHRAIGLVVMGIPMLALVAAAGLVGSLRAEVGRRAKSEAELRESRGELERAAETDRLTGLLNWAGVHDRLGETLGRRKADGSVEFALYYLDCDRFKVVNDVLGHAAGDVLLKQVAGRLTDSLVAVRGTGGGREPVVGRIGGDEFVVLLEGAGRAGEAKDVAERLAGALVREYDLNGYPASGSVSIGVTTSGAEVGEREVEQILRDADAAMYRAKSGGGGRWAMFDKAMRREAADRLMVETELRGAIERGELVLHYQPIVSLSTGALVGFEALVRWKHPQRGLIPPGVFIPVAEETGLIVPLGTWVLEEACRRMAGWQKQHADLSGLEVSVNVSRKQLARGDFAQLVESTIKTSGLHAGSLALEITESTVMADVEAAAGVLRSLKDLGVRIHLDDFGTGYSSLSCLHKYPIDVVKIDRSFIELAGERRDYAAVVGAIVTVAHNLRIHLVAEGVETGDQVVLLQALECDFGQGWFFGKPVEAEAALAMALTGRAKAA
jgi:diguanylate cyclase (GGDEF)-like protein